jgi:hypothetical protein
VGEQLSENEAEKGLRCIFAVVVDAFHPTK